MTWARICAGGYRIGISRRLRAYWEVFPGLRDRLFSANGREGYSDARIDADEVRKVVLQHGEFKAYGDRVRRVFDGWRRKHAPRLRKLAVAACAQGADSGLCRRTCCTASPASRCSTATVSTSALMDYWDEVMQDDVYLVVTEGWRSGRQIRPAEKGEEPDFSRKRGRKTHKYVGTLIPTSLVITRFFSKEQGLVDTVEAKLSVASQEKLEFEELHTADDGALSGLEGKNGVTKSNVDARVGDLKSAVLQAYPPGTTECIRAKAIAKTKFGTRPWEPGRLDEEGLFPELDVIHEWLQHSIAESVLRREHKLRTDRLYGQVEARYQSLTESEIRTLVVDDKWMASMEGAIEREVERSTGGLVDRVRVLEERYAKPLPKLARQVDDYSAKVEGHLKRMGLSE